MEVTAKKMKLKKTEETAEEERGTAEGERGEAAVGGGGRESLRWCPLDTGILRLLIACLRLTIKDLKRKRKVKKRRMKPRE